MIQQQLIHQRSKNLPAGYGSTSQRLELVSNFSFIVVYLFFFSNELIDYYNSTGKDGKEKVQCNYCKAHLLANSSGDLNRHSIRCIADHGAIVCSSQGHLGFTGSSQTSQNRVWIYSHENTQEKLAAMIIQHEYPFAMVEHQGFIDFMTTVQTQFKMPGRQTLCNDCIKLYKKK
jgi:hypothetical protein